MSLIASRSMLIGLSSARQLQLSVLGYSSIPVGLHDRPFSIQLVSDLWLLTCLLHTWGASANT